MCSWKGQTNPHIKEMCGNGCVGAAPGTSDVCTYSSGNANAYDDYHNNNNGYQQNHNQNNNNGNGYQQHHNQNNNPNNGYQQIHNHNVDLTVQVSQTRKK